jgi:hypothetical protein
MPRSEKIGCCARVQVVDEGLAHPTLIGRRDVFSGKTKQLGLDWISTRKPASSMP